MNKSLWKSPIFAAVAIAALAAGTALVAGYVDKPIQATQVAAEGKCSDCPRLNTEECCKVTGTCANPQTCAGDCLAEAGAGSCAGKQAGPSACCEGTPEGAPAGACPISGCEGPVESPCGAGGCCPIAK